MFAVAFTPVVTVPTGKLTDAYSGHSGLPFAPTIQGNLQGATSGGRVKAVMDYLAKHGIAKTRLVTKPWGMTKPLITPEKTPEDAQKTRRAEFKILKRDPAEAK